VDGLVIVGAQPELFEVIDALAAPCAFARRLHRRQQQGNQDANDGDHDQQLDEGERA
jgi:hypothetical protein